MMRLQDEYQDIIYKVKGYKNISHTELLETAVDHSKIHHIPSQIKHPIPHPQRGPTCGLVALYMVAIAQTDTKYQHRIPPPRKDGIHEESLRRIAKEMNLTVIGGIINVAHLQELAYEIGVDTTYRQPGNNEYHETLKEQLKNGKVAIVACDMGLGSKEAHQFPGNSKGYATHWALVIGFFYYRHADELHYIVSQYGEFFIWSADDLLKSNLQLPDTNPRAGESFKIIKINRNYQLFSSTGLENKYSFYLSTDHPEVDIYKAIDNDQIAKVITMSKERNGSFEMFRNAMLFVPPQNTHAKRRHEDDSVKIQAQQQQSPKLKKFCTP